MARPVAYITTPPPSHEEMIRRLRIPRKRQKELRAIMDEAWARLAKENEAPQNVVKEAEEKRKNASAAD